MKAVSKYIFLLGVPAALLLNSCTKKFEEYNKDSNRATSDDYTPAFSLTRAQVEFAGNHDFSFETWRTNIIYLSLMTQQLSSTTGWYNGDKYSRNEVFASSYFAMAYQDQVKYIMDLINITKDKPNYHNLYQVGRIMRVMIFHRITDLFGDVPYKEAGKGVSDRLYTPVYDPQSEIYADMLKELDEAAKALDNSKDAIPAGDLVYRGEKASVEKWKKLAYSLMLRLGMRMSKADQAKAKQWVEKAAAGGVMTSNNDNAFIVHETSGGRNTVNRNSNILSGEWDAIGKGNVYLSQTFVNFMKSNNDPRLKFIAEIKSSGDTSSAKQIGMPNGYDENNQATDIKKAPGFPGNINNYSTLQKTFLVKLDGPTFFLTYAQTELLLAEAALRGWSVPGDAATHYRNGVTAAMEQFAQFDKNAAISPAEISAYLAAHPFNAGNGYEQINTQYWANCFLDWYETWSNWRRSDFPKLKPVIYPNDNNGGKIPRRMLYPTAEASANAANYTKAVERQGPNNFDTRVWWDKP